MGLLERCKKQDGVRLLADNNLTPLEIMKAKVRNINIAQLIEVLVDMEASGIDNINLLCDINSNQDTIHIEEFIPLNNLKKSKAPLNMVLTEDLLQQLINQSLN